jgi:hypothetical protein
LSNSPWLQQCTPGCTCTHNIRLPHSIQLSIAVMWNRHILAFHLVVCGLWPAVVSNPVESPKWKEHVGVSFYLVIPLALWPPYSYGIHQWTQKFHFHS